MAANNLNILFWLYKSKLNRQGEAPIYLRIMYNMERRKFWTGYYINPSRWDSTKGTVKGLKDDAVQVNSYISKTKDKFMELFNHMLNDGDVNLDKLIEKFFGRDTNNMTLMELVQHDNTDFESRIGIVYTFSPFEKYDILKRKLEAFTLHKYKKNDVRLKDLGYVFMADGTVADPRLILAVALKVAACSIILAHNLPSASLKPSRADEELTHKIRQAAK